VNISNKTRRWEPIIKSELSRAGIPLPVDLVLTIIQIESQGKSGIINHSSGASGLMQVMPIVIKDYNQSHAVKYSIEDMRDANNPTAQIRVGIWVLGQFWKSAYKYLLGRLGTVDTSELMKIADLFYAAGPKATKKRLNKLSTPSYEAIREKYPTWNALPHTEKLSGSISALGTQFNLDAISDWLHSSGGGGGGGGGGTGTGISKSGGAAIALCILALGWWWFQNQKAPSTQLFE
jgi:hypothetical protein